MLTTDGRTEIQPSIEACFSDLDGTLIHKLSSYCQLLPNTERVIDIRTGVRGVTLEYTKGPHKGKTRACVIMPTLTSGDLYISQQTLDNIQQIRELGCKVVLITGGRSTTVALRWEGLPKADYYVMEGGGRIVNENRFVDLAWRDSMSHTTGVCVDGSHRYTSSSSSHSPSTPSERAPPATEGLFYEQSSGYGKHNHALVKSNPVPPEKRLGALWSAYRAFKRDGWHVDARGYYTAFRVNVKKSRPHRICLCSATGVSEETMRSERWLSLRQRLWEVTMAQVLGRYPQLSTAYNLGKADFFPKESGKANATAYLQRKLHTHTQQSVALGDDDNDIGMFNMCGQVILPDITHANVKELLSSAASSMDSDGGHESDQQQQQHRQQHQQHQQHQQQQQHDEEGRETKDRDENSAETKRSNTHGQNTVNTDTCDDSGSEGISRGRFFVVPSHGQGVIAGEEATQRVIDLLIHGKKGHREKEKEKKGMEKETEKMEKKKEEEKKEADRVFSKL